MSVADVKLTASNGGWLYSKGKFRKENGQVGYKQFRLPREIGTATKIAQALQMLWSQRVANDPNYLWTPEDIAKAFEFATPPSNVPASSSNGAQTKKTEEKPAPSTQSKMLFEAFDSFEKHMEERFTARKGVGESHYISTCDRIKAIKAHIPNVPLSSCDNEQLGRISSHLTTPLKSKAHLPKGEEPSKMIADATIVNWMTTIKMAFSYFTTKSVGWVPEDDMWRNSSPTMPSHPNASHSNRPIWWKYTVSLHWGTFYRYHWLKFGDAAEQTRIDAAHAKGEPVWLDMCTVSGTYGK